MHRPDPKAVGDHLGAYTGRAVVDHESVTGRLQYMAEHRVGPISGEGLRRHALVMKDRRKIAKRFQPVGQCRVAFAHTLERISRGRETAIGTRPEDYCIAMAGNNFVAIDHVEDRRTGLAFADPGFAHRVARLVIDYRLAGRRPTNAGQAQLLFGHGIAVGAAVFGDYHHLTEQPIGHIAGAALSAERGAVAAGDEGPLMLGV